MHSIRRRANSSRFLVNLMRILCLFLATLLAYPLSAQSDGLESFRQTSQELSASYQSGDFEAALKYANKAIENSIKEFGPESYEAATAYRDAGIVLKKLNRFKESVERFQKAVDIFLKLPSQKGFELIDTYQHLGTSQTFAERYKDARVSYEKALEIAEEKNGKESKESFFPVLNLANYFARLKKIKLAHQYYLWSYKLAYKHFAHGGREILQIQDSMVCLLTGVATDRQSKDFKTALRKQSGRSDSNNAGSVLNGKALFLPKPAYPTEAKNRLSGIVAVRVLIDEQGNVIEARAVCGNPILVDPSVKAAYGAKFSPTFLSNKAVKVPGIIIYRFIR